MNLKDMLRLVSVLSKKAGLTIEKYAEAVVLFEEATATERSTKDERIRDYGCAPRLCCGASRAARPP